MSEDLKKVLNLPYIVYILDTLIGDLEITIKIQNNYINRCLSNDESPEQKIPPEEYQRVTFSYLFLTLYKYLEFYEKYKATINHFITDGTPKSIYKELRSLGIKEFRDKYIGHIIDKETGDPLTDEKYHQFFQKINKKHKSLLAFYMKLDTYNFKNYPLITHLKEMQKTMKVNLDRILDKSKQVPKTGLLQGLIEYMENVQLDHKAH